MSKKDLNYIAGLEKAIKKKYGEEAIQNPASYWDKDKEEEYIQQLQERIDKEKSFEHTSELENVDGVLITRKLLNKERKLNCTVCNIRIKSINDDIYMIKHSCCERCYIEKYERHVPCKNNK